MNPHPCKRVIAWKLVSRKWLYFVYLKVRFDLQSPLIYTWFLSHMYEVLSINHHPFSSQQKKKKITLSFIHKLVNSNKNRLFPMPVICSLLPSSSHFKCGFQHINKFRFKLSTLNYHPYCFSSCQISASTNSPFKFLISFLNFHTCEWLIGWKHLY